MTPLIIPLPGNEKLADALARLLPGERGAIETRAFPDGETYLRFATDVRGRSVILVETLDRPNPKALPLLFAADAARDLGAARLVLAAPYLAYMRQDRRFHPGEAVTSVTFAGLVSRAFDALVTVDPHLHRYASLGALYSIPGEVVHAAPLLAIWIAANVSAPLLIGPDSESEQWVSEVARRAGAPYRVLQKQRFGDRQVEIIIPDLHGLTDRTPVLVDDIISSARTMIEAARKLRDQGFRPPTCVAVHALFAAEAEKELQVVAGRLVSTNTVAHHSNDIDVSGAIAEALRRLI
ncbi:MAG: ribose-phosphate pyrophosphokinase [Xanthobacteraceae bacterium]|nr:ribose-phosphate pyrophosphokinase [Xanthobacteraceae bacterium]